MIEASFDHVASRLNQPAEGMVSGRPTMTEDIFIGLGSQLAGG